MYGNTIYIKSFVFAKRNVNEAMAAQNKKDFIAKMSIASKEAREIKYWISLLIETGLDKSENHVSSFQSDIDEIIKIPTSIVKTSKVEKGKRNSHGK